MVGCVHRRVERSGVLQGYVCTECASVVWTDLQEHRLEVQRELAVMQVGKEWMGRRG